MWDLFADFMDDAGDFVAWLAGESPFRLRSLVSIAMLFEVLLGLGLAWEMVFR